MYCCCYYCYCNISIALPCYSNVVTTVVAVPVVVEEENHHPVVTTSLAIEQQQTPPPSPNQDELNKSLEREKESIMERMLPLPWLRRK